MATPMLVDGRNFLDPAALRAAGFTYEGIGRPTRERRSADAGPRPRRRGGHAAAPADIDGPEAGSPAGRSAVHPLHGRLARAPRGRRGRSWPAVSCPRSCARCSARRVAGGPRSATSRSPSRSALPGAIRFAADRGLLDERFLALNGDVLTDLDLRRTMRQSRGDRRRGDARRSIRSTTRPPTGSCAGSATDGEIGEFLEKPDPAEIDTDEVSAGAYVLERSVARPDPGRSAVSIEREVFPRLVGQGLYVRRLEGYWMDIGTPERYLQASWDILERRVETEAAQRLDDGPCHRRRGRRFATPAEHRRWRVGRSRAPREVADGAVLGGLACCGRSPAARGRGRQRRAARSSVDFAARSRSVRARSVGAGCVIGEGARVDAGATLERALAIGPGERRLSARKLTP